MAVLPSLCPERANAAVSHVTTLEAADAAGVSLRCRSSTTTTFDMSIGFYFASIR